MITLDEIKAHLRIEHTDEDTYLSHLSSAAIAKIENDTDYQLTPKSLVHRVSQFTDSIRLPKFPVVDVTAITYQDDTNQTQTVSSWQLVHYPTYAELHAYFDEVWPRSNGRPNSVEIEYEVGGDVAPVEIKQSALLLIGHWYANRETVVIGATPASLPMAYESLIQPYRRYA